DTLEAVEQRVDDARLEVDDPRKAFVYAQQEARLGNFSPILRLLEGDKKVAQLKEDELRAEAAEATGKRPEDLAGVPRARLMQMMMISDVWIEALETIDVEVSLNRPEEVSLTVHRATGATGY